MYEYGDPSGDNNQDDFYYKYDHNKRIPDEVEKFIKHFCAAIQNGNVFEIQNMYENTFPSLSEKYYDKNDWPSDKELKFINDPNFLILYKELYFRHIHARSKNPSLQMRSNSFLNYCDLFNLILLSQTPVALELPDIWLWELVDDFVYQFQNFAYYRARLTDKSESDKHDLNTNAAKHWNILCILNVLHSLIDASNIKVQLEVAASGGDPESVAGEFGRHSFYKMLGYFSLIGLLRLHSILGDYYQAIKVLEPIEIHKKSKFTHIPACQISTSYYVGFSYMMMRRYSDAIRTFSSILLYIQRTKQLYR